MPSQKTIVSALASAARTASVNSAVQSSRGSRGLVVIIDTTLVPAANPSNVVTIEGYDTVSGKFYTLLVSAAITGVGVVILRVYPELIAAVNLIASDVIPGQWRIRVTSGNANSVTYSIAAHLIN